MSVLRRFCCRPRSEDGGARPLKTVDCTRSPAGTPHLGVDRNRVHAVLLAGADDAARDLAAVGDQHLGARVLEVIWAPVASGLRVAGIRSAIVIWKCS